MTLAAPRSRQGRLLLVLAFLAASVAVVGAFLWASQASANLPTTTVTLTQSPATPATVSPGDTVTYTMTTTTSGVNTNGAVTMTITLGSGLQNSTSVPTCPATNTGGAGITWTAGGAGTGTLTCVSSGVLTASIASGGVMTVTAKAAPVGPVAAPSGSVKDADNVPVNATAGPSVGPLTVNGVTNSGNTSVIAGGMTVITFTVPVGLTYCSDVDGVTARTFNANPTTGDLVVVPASAVVTGPSATLNPDTLADTATVTVNSANPGSVTATLSTHLGTSVVTTDCTTSVVTATFAAPGGYLRHLDLPDAGTEDAAIAEGVGTGTAPCPSASPSPSATPGFLPAGVCGLLKNQDDVDDAQGSFHGACIEGSSLTFAANGAQITWSITPVAGGPLPASVTPFAGPSGEPCVAWGAGSTGTQQITAAWTSGTTTVTFYFNGSCTAGVCTSHPGNAGVITNPLPLIKEWNTIDSTRIVKPAAGNLGENPIDKIAGNTGGAAAWSDRNCSIIPPLPNPLGTDHGDCTLPNLDGLTLPVESSFILNGSFIKAGGSTFIDYTMGHHADAGGAYTGPVDGAQQTYTISGDCGSIRLEDPATGNIIVLSNPEGTDLDNVASATILSSDKGVAFQFVPNDSGLLLTTIGNADCGANSTICVTIATTEANQFHSPPLLSVKPDEKICVNFHVGPPTNKTPILAWAGQRVVLENYWGDPTVTDPNATVAARCPIAPTNTDGPQSFGVLYSKQNGPGGFTGQLVHGDTDVIQTNDNAIVHVSPAPDTSSDGVTEPNSNCTSRIIIESEDQGQVDVSAYVVDNGSTLADATPLSQQVAFVIYFMKFESQTLQLIPDNIPATDVWDKGGTPTTDPVTATVSDNVAAVVHVKGWVLTDNCPSNAARTGTGKADGQVGEPFPANRCIFPDDWAFKAGAYSQLPQCGPTATLPVPQQCRPEFDIASTTDYTTLCPADQFIAGPFSLLDQITHAGRPVGCGDSLAPYPPATGGTGTNCLTGGLTYACRDSNFPDGVIDTVDAPMPPALVQFDLNGSGFLHGIGKAAAGVDTGFAAAAIPAEPWISQTNSDGEGYVWNTWGTAGANKGLYQYWTSLASHGPEVVSCAGKSSGAFVDPSNPSINPCTKDPAPIGLCQALPATGVGCVRTGGFAMTEVYSDEHGVAMSLINGDANLSFSGCSTSAPVSGTTTPIVLLNGFFCKKGAAVGTSTLTSVVDYPDKRKHFAELTNSDTINWTWNGTKDVTVVADPADATGQFHYVVFHVTDRDGFCGQGGSLHPVLGERVDFRIDSTTGFIVPDVNGNSAEGPAVTISADAKSATTHTFDTAVNEPITATESPADNIVVGPVLVTGECQAWIHVSESQLKPVNVTVTAFDPEGTVTFDTQAINPTPTPSPTPAPTPSPTATPVPTKHVTWGDWDCNGSIDIGDAVIDARKVVGLSFTAPAGCPTVGSTLSVTQDGHTQNRVWGDADCSGGATPIDIADAINIERAIVHLPITVFDSSCPGLGETVTIPA